MRTPGPPSWAAGLLDRVLPGGGSGSSVRADLDDEFRELSARVSLRVARRWYAWEALKITAHFAWVGLRGVFDMNRTLGGPPSCTRAQPAMTSSMLLTANETWSISFSGLRIR